MKKKIFCSLIYNLQSIAGVVNYSFVSYNFFKWKSEDRSNHIYQVFEELVHVIRHGHFVRHFGRLKMKIESDQAVEHRAWSCDGHDTALRLWSNGFQIVTGQWDAACVQTPVFRSQHDNISDSDARRHSFLHQLTFITRHCLPMTDDWE